LSRGLSVGLALVSVYLGGTLLTARLTGRPARVLYDGFAPPVPYQWVNPPRELRSGNVVPAPKVERVELGPDGSPRRSVSSADGQLVLNLAAGAVAPAGDQTAATFTLTPLDPAGLAALPRLAADGNAYRVDVAYEPSGQIVDSFASPVNVLFVVPQPADTLFASADGQAWQPLETSAISSTSSAAPAGRPGYFLAGAAETLPAGGGQPSDVARTVAAVAVTALLAVALWFAPVLVNRLPRRRGSR
jgi:hypothetical protein